MMHKISHPLNFYQKLISMWFQIKKCLEKDLKEVKFSIFIKSILLE